MARLFVVWVLRLQESPPMRENIDIRFPPALSYIPMGVATTAHRVTDIKISLLQIHWFTQTMLSQRMHRHQQMTIQSNVGADLAVVDCIPRPGARVTSSWCTSFDCYQTLSVSFTVGIVSVSCSYSSEGWVMVYNNYNTFHSIAQDVCDKAGCDMTLLWSFGCRLPWITCEGAGRLHTCECLPAVCEDFLLLSLPNQVLERESLVNLALFTRPLFQVRRHLHANLAPRYISSLS